MRPSQFAPLPKDRRGIDRRLDGGWPFWMAWMETGHFGDYIDQVIPLRMEILMQAYGGGQ